MFSKRTNACALLLYAVLATSNVVHAQGGHEHHHHSEKPSANEASVRPAQAVPSLRILMPESGDTVSRQLAVVFETAANLADMTMSAPIVGVHLHIGYDDVSLMPTRQQLISLGKHRYLFLFDLPVIPGAKTLRVYWSDAQHRTIESTMQNVEVTVQDASP